jgi:hypothetical protein
MPTLTEGMHPGEFLLSELQGYMSRENVIVASGEVLQPGTVIGFTTALPAAIPGSANVGNGAVTVHGIGAGARVGSYSAVCLTAGATGTFKVTGPDSAQLGTLTVGTRFTNSGLDVTIADGATDFAVGDTFTFPIARGLAKAWTAAAGDGTQTVGGIVIYKVDASAGAVRTVAIVRQAAVNGRHLMYAAGTTETNKEVAKTGLRTLGIMVD